MYRTNEPPRIPLSPGAGSDPTARDSLGKLMIEGVGEGASFCIPVLVCLHGREHERGHATKSSTIVSLQSSLASILPPSN